MNQSQYLLPGPIGNLLSHLPVYPGSVLFVAGLNLALARHLAPDVQGLLSGKKFRIAITDAKIGFDFAWRNGAFSACRHGDAADLTIGASAHDFFLLAQRIEDPDTLFFSRRLSMEGDTELGLLVKNSLDAIELPAFDPSKFLPARVSALFRARQGGGSGVA